MAPDTIFLQFLMNLYLLLKKTDLIEKKMEKKSYFKKNDLTELPRGFAMTMQENVKSIEKKKKKKKNQLREKVRFNAHCIPLAENPQI